MMRNKDSVLCAAQPATVFRAVDACAPCCHNGMDWNHWDRNVRQCSNSGCNSGWDNRTGCDSCTACTAANANSCNSSCNSGWDNRTGCDSCNTCTAANVSGCDHGCTTGCTTRTGCDSCTPCTAASASSCDHGCTTGCTTRTGCDSCTAANTNSCNSSCTTGCTTRTGCDSCTAANANSCTTGWDNRTGCDSCTTRTGCDSCAAASASGCTTGCTTRTGCTPCTAANANSCNTCTAANTSSCNRSCTVCPNCNGCTACTAARCPVCARTACTCGGSLTPAMVYETPHCLNDLHGMEEAIRKGTLFSELYMPMNGECADACGANLCEGQAEAFAAWELRLYLNTHPYDQQALEMFRSFCHRGDRSNYACAFAFDNGSPNRWSWTDAPWPWEFNTACENNCCCN